MFSFGKHLRCCLTSLKHFSEFQFIYFLCFVSLNGIKIFIIYRYEKSEIIKLFLRLCVKVQNIYFCLLFFTFLLINFFFKMQNLQSMAIQLKRFLEQKEKFKYILQTGPSK